MSGAAVRAAYLDEKGITSSVSSAIWRLVSNPSGLPENPFFHLGPELAAFQDQGGLWEMQDQQVIDTTMRPPQSQVQVLDSVRKLGKVPDFPQAWGLPHVLKLVDVEAVESLHLVLRTLPGSLSTLATLDQQFDDDFQISFLTSVQGPCLLPSASLPPLVLPPYLLLRVDVQVKGSSLEGAMDQLVFTILDDARQLDEGLHMVHRIVIEHPHLTAHSEVYRSSQNKDLHLRTTDVRQTWTLGDLEDEEEEGRFTSALKSAVIGRQRIYLEASLATELGVPTEEEGVAKSSWSWSSLVVEYFLHFTDTKSLFGDNTTSFQSTPLESMFFGLFFDQFTAERYIDLYGMRTDPYTFGLVEPNKHRLQHLLVREYSSGDRLGSFAHLLVALELDRLSIASAAHPLAASGLPLLLRVLNSQAATLRGLAHQVHALQQVVQSLKEQSALEAAEERAEAVNDWLEDEEEAEWQRAREERRARAVSRGAHTSRGIRAVRGWIRQLVRDSPTVEVQLVAPQLLRLLSSLENEDETSGEGEKDPPPKKKSEEEAEEESGLIAMSEETSDTLRAVHELCLGVAYSMADAASRRCRLLVELVEDYAGDLRQLQLGYGDSKAVTLEGGLDVDSRELVVAAGAAGRRIRERRIVPPGIMQGGNARAGVGLQYMVDTDIVGFLKEVYAASTSPPMPENPYPAILRSALRRGYLLHSTGEPPGELTRLFHSPMVLTHPEGFIYASSRRERESALEHNEGLRNGELTGREDEFDEDEDEEEQSSRRSTDDEDEEEEEGEEGAVYGLFSALPLADPDSVSHVASALGGFLGGRRQWKQGGFQADVITAITGDVVQSALQSSLPSLPASMHLASVLRRGASKQERDWVQLAIRTRLELAEVHLVEGPEIRAAAVAFGEMVVIRIVNLHSNTLSPGMHHQRTPRGMHLPPEGLVVHSLTIRECEETHSKRDREWTLAELHRDRVDVVRAIATSALSRQSNGTQTPHQRVFADLSCQVYGAYYPLVLQFHLHFTPSSSYKGQVFHRGTAGLHRHHSSTPHSGNRDVMMEDSTLQPQWSPQEYTYLFTRRSDALLWMSRHVGHSDPADPTAVFRISQELEERASRCFSGETSREVLDGHRLQLTSATIRGVGIENGDSGAVKDGRGDELRHSGKHAEATADALARHVYTLRSTAQVICVLSSTIRMLKQMALSTGDNVALKIDWKAAQRSLLQFCATVLNFVLDESYCPLTGVPLIVNDALTQLQLRAEEGLRMGTEDIEMLEKIDIWIESLAFIAIRSLNEQI